MQYLRSSNLFDAVPKRNLRRVTQEAVMYTGTMIDELMEVVTRAEQHQALIENELSLRKSVPNSAGFSTHIYEPIVIQRMAVA